MKPQACALAILGAATLALCPGRVLSDGPEFTNVPCPPSCRDLFGRMNEHGVQEVEFQLRGEPKSGSTTSGEWAWGGLVTTCNYLKTLYGQRSCRLQSNWKQKRFSFEFVPGPPDQVDNGAMCVCDNVKRVKVVLSTYLKHDFPVREDCAFRHRDYLVMLEDQEEHICARRDGLPVENEVDIWRCVEEADCVFNDDRLQFAVIRDPRPATVSSFFHRKAMHPNERFKFDDSLDAYFQHSLKFVCMWTSIRYLLFTKLLAHQSVLLFYFEEMFVDQVDWYGRLLSFVGLKLPSQVIFDMAEYVNSGGKYKAYPNRGVNGHKGGEPKQLEGAKRTFRDELGLESLAMMDDVLRTWIPPVLLQRFGVDI